MKINFNITDIIVCYSWFLKRYISICLGMFHVDKEMLHLFNAAKLLKWSPVNELSFFLSFLSFLFSTWFFSKISPSINTQCQRSSYLRKQSTSTQRRLILNHPFGYGKIIWFLRVLAYEMPTT